MRKLIIAMVITLFVIPCFAQVYGPTKSTDHLWKIASINRPSKSVSIQQTMLAILHATPKAFLYGNVNGIKSGYYLTIPSLATIKRISPNKAIQLVHQQNKAWSKLQHKPIPHAKANQSLIKLRTLQRQNQKAVLAAQQQLAIVNKTIMTLNQNYQARLAMLEQNNVLFKTQLQRINQQVMDLHGQMQRLQLQSQKYRSDYWFWLFGIAIILVLLVLIHWWLIARYKKKIALRGKETEAEYDFMSSAESIPVKLDLARTYIDMKDKKAARKVLKEIMAKGNKKQQQEADKLLQQLK